MRVDADRLLMLGGTANPRGKVEYSIASNTWTILPDLPFSLQNGACLTTDMPGKIMNKIKVLFFFLVASHYFPQMIALNMEKASVGPILVS